MSKELAKTYDPKGIEDKLYQKWLEKKYFHAEVDNSKKPFTIVIPPPNITGQLHMGHALDNTMQDILIRFKRMQGYNALWQPGTDHASIATEVKIIEKLKEEGIELLYHNHNCEFRKIDGQTAYERIVEQTDPAYVNFEFDSYWPTEAGVNAAAWMQRLGNRMKLYHINDRGSRVSGKTSSILTSDSMELGYGNMDLTTMVDIAKENGVDAIVLESHRNWVDKSPIKSFQCSAQFLNSHV